MSAKSGCDGLTILADDSDDNPTEMPHNILQAASKGCRLVRCRLTTVSALSEAGSATAIGAHRFAHMLEPMTGLKF